MNCDHYAVLGLPPGEVGAKLSDKEIAKAYRIKALELHPDKRPNDPNAQTCFQKLKASYEILKDEKARKQFDDLLRRTTKRKSTNDAKREKMMSDLERAEMMSDHEKTGKEEEEERIWKKLREEIAEIRAKHKRKQEEELASMYAKRRRAAATPPMPPRWKEENEDGPWKSLERFQAYEDLVLRNMRRAAERQKMSTNGNGN
ncbi:dnaJ homolog subfamily C member 17-like [Ipomoea triloba]|uniref:dnaJ homolog subfamily C member 17-like n=1 Tax=Ipomoea triloba TaxID=35885 RepID=UPI00125D3AEC|nr:dnaJ homolog subfamily C member 17-like [Ipomoea triloba]